MILALVAAARNIKSAVENDKSVLAFLRKEFLHSGHFKSSSSKYLVINLIEYIVDFMTEVAYTIK